MKILYFSDGYGHDIMTGKRSIREELEGRGVSVAYHGIGAVTHVRSIVDVEKPDQVWLVHSSLVLPCDKALIKAPVVGFGFSDPHYFSPARLGSYDAYVTAHYETYLKYKGMMPVHYNPDCYDTRFHRVLGVMRDIDATCIGAASHPRFENKLERVEIVDRLRGETSITIRAFGRGWPAHLNNHAFVAGDELVSTMNRSMIGLDIQGGLYSLSERVFHYGGCGTPVITRGCADVDMAFTRDEDILTYDTYDELKEKLVYYIGAPEELRRIGEAAHKRCVMEHTVGHRVSSILAFMEREVG